MYANERTVRKNRGSYVVKDVQNLSTKVDANKVDLIASSLPMVEKEEIAVILATIEIARITPSDQYNKLTTYEKMDDETENNAITKLLTHYDAEVLINCFEEMKYYEIKALFEADDPVFTLHEFL